MKIEFEPEECLQLFSAITACLLEDASLSDEDRAALKRWRSTSMKPGSDGMKELSGRLNADLARTLQNKARSPFVRPDWK